MPLRAPGMAAAAVLTLALGIGANTAVYSGVYGLLVNPSPGVRRSGELVELYAADPALGTLSLSTPEYRDYRDRNDVFSGLFAFGLFPMNLAEGEATERVWAMVASGNYFDVLGVRAAHGRTFLPADDAGAGQPVAVISYGFWQRRFAGSSEIVGKTILLNGQAMTVVGVAPAEFHGTITGLTFDAWIPLALQDQFSGWRRSEDRGSRWLGVTGRLKPGVGLAQAEARLNLIARELARDYPVANKDLAAALFPASRSPRGAQNIMGSLSVALLALTALLLLIACANVANLLFSRSVARQREIAVRMALGASRATLVRQLLTESLMLAAVGGLAGWVLSLWTSRWLLRLAPPADIPFHLEVRVDPGVLLFALGLTTVTGIIFGLIPALQSSRTDLVSTLKDDLPGAGGGLGKSRLRAVLVVAQVAFSLVLLVAAGLFLRSLLNAQTVETGFNPRNVLLGTLDLPTNRYDRTKGAQFFERVIERVEVLPGVRGASLVRRVPLGFGSMGSGDLQVEGYAPQGGERVWSYRNNIGPGFFRALEIPLVHGREFTFQDNLSAARVAVINETLAERYFQGRDPIGQRVRFDGEGMTVIGVVREFKNRQLNEAPASVIFIPHTQFYLNYMTLVVRTEDNPAAVAPVVQRLLREMDAQLPLYAVRTLEGHIQAASFPQRAASSFLSVFGVVALLLAAVGIYGVMSYNVAQRIREIGIRMALGAQREHILRLILGEGARMALAGVSLGLAGAFVATRILGRFLLGVGPRDAATFAGVTVVLSLVALVACYLPARRAMRVDPVVALRHQ